MKFGFAADLYTGNKVEIDKRICIGCVDELGCGLPLKSAWIMRKCTRISARQTRWRNCPVTSAMICLREARVEAVLDFPGGVRNGNH